MYIPQYLHLSSRTLPGPFDSTSGEMTAKRPKKGREQGWAENSWEFFFSQRKKSYTKSDQQVSLIMTELKIKTISS